MSSSTVKQRHYSALASRIRTLHANLAETEGLLEMMTHQLDATSKMGVHCGSQYVFSSYRLVEELYLSLICWLFGNRFMAVSRLLDKELKDLMDAATASEPQSPFAAPSPERSS